GRARARRAPAAARARDRARRHRDRGPARGGPAPAGRGARARAAARRRSDGRGRRRRRIPRAHADGARLDGGRGAARGLARVRAARGVPGPRGLKATRPGVGADGGKRAPGAGVVPVEMATLARGQAFGSLVVLAFLLAGVLALVWGR